MSFCIGNLESIFLRVGELPVHMRVSYVFDFDIWN